MEQTAEKEPPVLDLATLQAEALPELQGWREKQQAIAKKNPFIAIKNHKTYTEAKKRRTALVSARTSIQDQEKIIASQLKQFRTRVGEVSKELIEITFPHEEKQQAEVKRYEAKKEEERLEKERIEKERVDGIKNRIDNFYSIWKKIISELEFKDIESTKNEIVTQLKEQDQFDFAEFKEDFNEKVTFLKVEFQERVKFLNDQETARIDREKLEKEKADFEAKKKKDEDDRKAKEEAEKKKQEEITAKKVAGFIERLKENGYTETVKEKFYKEGYSVSIETLKSLNEDEFNSRIEEVDSNIKRDAELKSLREAQEKADADKKAREEKEAADKKALEEAEQKKKDAAAEQARLDAEAKRIEELKPDVDKMLEYIDSFRFTKEYPELKDTSANEVLESLLQSHKDWIASANDRIQNLK